MRGLVAYWNLDEASGDALDSYSTNDLTDSGGAGSGTGILNGCRTVNSSQGLSSSASALNDTAECTLAGWCKSDSLAGNFKIFSLFSDDLFLRWNASNSRLELVFGGSVIAQITPSWSANTWGFFAIASTGVNVTLTFNGTTASATYAASVRAYMGLASTSLGQTLSVDETGYWTRQLSSSQIAALYNSGTPPGLASFT